MPSREPVMVLEGRKFRFTKHAQQRALEMKVKATDIHKALTKPTKVVESNSNPGVSYWTHGAIALAVAYDELDIGTTQIRTVLWANAGKWALWEDRNPESDRTYRPRSEWNVPQGLSA